MRLWLLLGGCSPSSVDLLVVDESGAPVAGAELSIADVTATTNSAGEARFDLPRPGLGMVRADGFLDEPLPLGLNATDGTIDLTLLDAAGRFVVHSTGDVMLGRRYEAPTEGDPLIDPDDDGSSAEAVVSDVAEALSAADLVTTNLETVVADLPDEDAYPGKRWLLQTPPAALAAFDPLGVDVVGTANNHQRDWMEAGIERSLAALDAHGLDHVGSGLTAADAAVPITVDVDGVRVAQLAYTSVDGDYVNDQYPSDDDVAPASIAEEDRFKWEARTWGAPAYGIPEADRRIGGAWAVVKAIIDELPEADQATLWTSVTATWPELQDWVARRGHGGGHLWTNAAPTEIAAARADADLVIVQLHMGFQFASAPGEAVVSAAREAVDAGADLVVCHHPHVLQGFEIYNGHLIAYSMGNFLFDQDFLSTFRSSWLRTIWEGTTLVEARVIPTMLDGYRPVPVVDRLATDVGRTLWEASLLDATAIRGADLGVRSVAQSSGRGSIGMVEEHGTFRITETLPATQTTQFTLTATDDTAVRLPGLVRRRVTDSPPDDLWVGRSLSGYGSFEDDDGDGMVDETQAWTWTSFDIALDTARPLSGNQSLSLYRGSWNSERVSARMTARVPLPAHRLFGDADGTVVLDGDARYSLRLRARYDGWDPQLVARLAVYHFDDLNPTEDPESTLLREVELPIDVKGGAAQTLRVDLGDDVLASVAGLEANAVLLYLSLEPGGFFDARMFVDDVELIEWRRASEEPEGWAALDWLRSDAGEGEVGVDWVGW